MTTTAPMLTHQYRQVHPTANVKQAKRAAKGSERNVVRDEITAGVAEYLQSRRAATRPVSTGNETFQRGDRIAARFAGVEGTVVEVYNDGTLKWLAEDGISVYQHDPAVFLVRVEEQSRRMANV